MYNNKTFPDKIGDVTDCNGLPFDTKNESYEIRVKKLFKRIFQMAGKYELVPDIWNILKNMVLKPNQLFSIVEIDGFLSDISGRDDIALTFNMGIPRLRGRNINYLDRIYLRLPKNGNIKFYNSGIENDEIYWNKSYKVPAWHPHIQNGEPCLGSYGTELARLKSERNPIAYLQTVHMFLNTWNRQSPFWQLNSATIDHHCDNKEFKHSKIYNAFHLRGSSPTREKQDFVLNNINKINTGSIPNDISILVDILGRLELTRDHLGGNIRAKMNEEEYFYIRSIHDENVERRNSSRGVYHPTYTIINNSTRHNILIPVRYTDASNQSRTSTQNKLIKTDKITNDSNYNTKKEVAKSLNYLLESVYNYLKDGKIYDFILEKPDYAIKMHCQYYTGLVVKRNELYDEMTATNSYNERITHLSNEIAENSVQKEYKKAKRFLKNFIANRYRRINSIILKSYNNMFTNDLVSEAIATKLKEAFSYEILDHEQYDGTVVKQLHSRGEFWNNLHVYEPNEKFEETLNIFNKKFPQNLTELITVYENIKEELIQLESDHLIDEYTKVIRSLKDYGSQTNNTQESTQQVHLSFE